MWMNILLTNFIRMANQKKNTENKSGRPKKQSRVRPNSGRKPVAIDKASRTTKYRRALNLMKSTDHDSSVVQLTLKLCKQKENVEPENCDKMKNDDANNILRHSEESAFAFYLENNLNANTYKALVADGLSRNCNLYPCYNKLRKAMTECQLEESQYKVSETEIAVPLQIMLNKTAERLCDAVAFDWDKRCLKDLQLFVSLGFDSSSSHLNPHQKCSDPENECLTSQTSLFISSLLIIQLRSKIHDKLWINPTPQSVRFCRPLRIAVEKEDEAAILKEYSRLSTEIYGLVPHEFNMKNGKSVKVHYQVSKTLFDGKCVNTIVGNKATCRCPLCNRTNYAFGNSEDDFTPTDSFLELGLGLLHCEINSFQHLLHLAYRNTKDIKTWDINKQLKGNIKNMFYF